MAFGVQYLRRGVEALGHSEREDVLQYASWLDTNLWAMTQKEEFRQAFDEVDLDYDECFRQLQWSVGGALSPNAQKSVDSMHRQFAQWFDRMLNRVGLGEAARPTTGAVLTDDEPPSGPVATPVEANDALPWDRDRGRARRRRAMTGLTAPKRDGQTLLAEARQQLIDTQDWRRYVEDVYSVDPGGYPLLTYVGLNFTDTEIQELQILFFFLQEAVAIRSRSGPSRARPAPLRSVLREVAADPRLRHDPSRGDVRRKGRARRCLDPLLPHAITRSPRRRPGATHDQARQIENSTMASVRSSTAAGLV